MIVSGGIVVICAILAFALSAVCGGGASFILIPILGWLLPGAQVPAALSIGTATSSVSRIMFFYHSIRWKIVLRFVPPAIPAAWLGAWMLTYINPIYLECILGIFLVSNLTLIFKPNTNVSTSGMPGYALSLIGFIAGFVSGLTGAVGLLFNRFYLRYGLSKEEIVATRAANELLLHFIKLALYASFGLLTKNVLLFGLLIAVAAIFSSMGIKRVLPFISEQLFRRIGYTAMVASGMFMLTSAVLSIVQEHQAQISYHSVEEGIETKLKWNQRTFEVDFEYGDEGFEIEYGIKLADLPEEKQRIVRELSTGADTVLLEEVYGFNKHYYEVYVYKAGKLEKHDI